jgi:hypothetical protein
MCGGVVPFQSIGRLQFKVRRLAGLWNLLGLLGLALIDADRNASLIPLAFAGGRRQRVTCDRWRPPPGDCEDRPADSISAGGCQRFKPNQRLTFVFFGLHQMTLPARYQSRSRPTQPDKPVRVTLTRLCRTCGMLKVPIAGSIASAVPGWSASRKKVSGRVWAWGQERCLSGVPSIVLAEVD